MRFELTVSAFISAVKVFQIFTERFRGTRQILRSNSENCMYLQLKKHLCVCYIVCILVLHAMNILSGQSQLKLSSTIEEQYRFEYRNLVAKNIPTFRLY